MLITKKIFERRFLAKNEKSLKEAQKMNEMRRNDDSSYNKCLYQKKRKNLCL